MITEENVITDLADWIKKTNSAISTLTLKVTTLENASKKVDTRTSLNMENMQTITENIKDICDRQNGCCGTCPLRMSAIGSDYTCLKGHTNSAHEEANKQLEGDK